jgi:hypothetical protein
LELTKEYQTQQSEIGRLVTEFGAAKSESDKDSLRDEIAKATAKQFDLRQQVRAREVEQLKERLTEVEKTINERNELKDKIVEKRVADILREPDQLGWEPLSIAPAPNGLPFFSAPYAISPSTVDEMGAGLPAPVPVPLSSIDHSRSLSIPETEAWLERERTKSGVITLQMQAAEAWLKLVKTGVRTPEMQTAEAQLELKKLSLDQARVVERIIEEPMVDAEGNVKTARRHVYDTESAEVGPVIGEPSDNALPHFRSRYREQGLVATEHQPISSMNITVAEAEVRARIAQEKRDALRTRFEAGEGELAEMIAQEGELEVAKLILARAKTENEARSKLLELDVRQAESVFEQAHAALAESQEINKRSPNAIPSTQILARKAALEQAEIEWERAKTRLESHQKSNVPLKESPETQPRR